MSEFNKIIEDLKNQLEPLAKLMVKDYVNDATEDGKMFINKIKVDLGRWTSLLQKGEINVEEFEWLVQSKKDLAEMVLLKQKGLGLVKVSQFKGSLVNLIVEFFFDKFEL